MTYDELLQEAEDIGLIVKEKPLKAYRGRIKGNKIAIKKDISENEKACVLAEELGHYYTTVGNILNLSDVRNAKQEYQARLWAYNKQVKLLGIIQAYENRCKDLYEMAEYLNVTEDFLSEALECYRCKYGISVKIDNYIIYFEPNLYVMKLL
ncbi:ImmA/IrrE family metallo-endopeptidase [Sedimentibacter sp.]|uniref:ImmA/IrrE family metallo-endopeptidase n=1 Tax=Sedimentibacter sp. TaxID=1960295 RepID=UPI0028B2083A|nr:ImmA/IrrE family metallo-endopeptidase [Sedimentibacter sp.]